MPDGHCRWPSSRELMGGGETLHHEIPMSTIRFPENRLGGSGHVKTGHLASKSRVMLTTPKVLARDTITQAGVEFIGADETKGPGVRLKQNIRTKGKKAGKKSKAG